MVGNDAHGDVGLGRALVGTVVFYAADVLHKADDGRKNVGVVGVALALQNHGEALEAHAGIHMFGGQLFERAVGLAVELNEHVVPDFHHLGVVLIHEFVAGHEGALGVAAQVHMYFGAGAAGTGVAHFPEIVFFVAVKNLFAGQEAQPKLEGFVVAVELFFFIAAEYRSVEAVFGDAEHVVEQLPRPGNGFVFEIVADAPVAQHFKHGMVGTVVAYIFEVIVFARHAHTLLRVRNARIIRRLVAEKEVFELVHARVGEHEGGVFAVNDGGGGHDFVAFGSKKIEEGFADFACGHHI